MPKLNEKGSALSIYLVREDRVDQFEKVLVTGANVLPLQDGWDGYVIAMQSPRVPPTWQKILREILKSPSEFSLSTESPGALAVIRLSGKTFVLSFGHAWAKLQEEWLEQSFGRRVALNSIDPDKLVEINLEQVFANWHQSRERSPRASSVNEFGVEFDRDLVASIEGLSSKKLFGKKLRGATNLRIQVPFSQLRKVLDSAGRHFDSDDYKKRWPEVDNISPLDDLAQLTELDAQLDAELKAGVAQKKLVMFTPTYRHDTDALIDSYIFGRRIKSAVTRPYLMVESWQDYLKQKGLEETVENAKNTPIHLLDDDSEETRKANAYQCFGYHLSLHQNEFILSSGVWYEVTGDFLAKINSELAAIQTPKLKLPAWNKEETEPEYNARCGQIPGFLSMDVKPVMVGGKQSKLEFCDTLHLQSKTLYFAKIASKSSGMSHLLEQTRRTEELFFAPGDSSYRKALQRVIKTHHKGTPTEWLEGKPKNGDWNLCLVSLGRTKEDLPFFAKCGLARLYRELRRQGHEVSFLRV